MTPEGSRHASNTGSDREDSEAEDEFQDALEEPLSTQDDEELVASEEASAEQGMQMSADLDLDLVDEPELSEEEIQVSICLFSDSLS